MKSLSGCLFRGGCPGRVLPFCFLLAGMIPVTSLAQLSPVSRADAPIIKYRTREEKREAGLTTELTSWLRFQGEAESEFRRKKTRFFEDSPDLESNTVDPSAQFNLEISFSENIETELILQYTEDSQDPVMEELIISWDIDNLGLSVGRYYIPFGEYFSNFINGPLIEFTETRGDVIQVDYDFNDVVEIGAYLFDSGSKKQTGSKITDNWGLTFEAKLLDNHLLLGGGWLSNIADGDFRPLEDENNIFERAVPAWNLYLIAEWENGGFSFEQVKATRSFRELDAQEDSPEAWNIEATWYPSPVTEFAVRYERSRELAEEAKNQSGIEFTWRPANRLSLSAEFIRQEFLRDFVFDDQNREVRDGYLVAGSLAYIF